MPEVFYQMIDTPLGEMMAAATEKGICLLEFHDRKMLPTQVERVTQYFGSAPRAGTHPWIEALSSQLEEYFTGKRKNFELPLVYPGSDFQVRVWESLLTIPYGKTRSYQQQSQILGNAKAIRAMAKANGDNRLAILIPCHRVIGSNGEMVGYGGKIWRKKRLLELEGALVKQGVLF